MTEKNQGITYRETKRFTRLMMVELDVIDIRRLKDRLPELQGELVSKELEKKRAMAEFDKAIKTIRGNVELTTREILRGEGERSVSLFWRLFDDTRKKQLVKEETGEVIDEKFMEDHEQQRKFSFVEPGERTGELEESNEGDGFTETDEKARQVYTDDAGQFNAPRMKTVSTYEPLPEPLGTCELCQGYGTIPGELYGEPCLVPCTCEAGEKVAAIGWTAEQIAAEAPEVDPCVECDADKVKEVGGDCKACPDYPENRGVAGVESTVDRTHEECDLCMRKDEDPPQCSGHAPGPTSCPEILTETVYCHPCSVAGGAECAVHHAPPACRGVADGQNALNVDAEESLPFSVADNGNRRGISAEEEPDAPMCPGVLACADYLAFRTKNGPPDLTATTEVGIPCFSCGSLRPAGCTGCVLRAVCNETPDVAGDCRDAARAKIAEVIVIESPAEAPPVAVATVLEPGEGDSGGVVAPEPSEAAKPEPTELQKKCPHPKPFRKIIPGVGEICGVCELVTEPEAPKPGTLPNMDDDDDYPDPPKPKPKPEECEHPKDRQHLAGDAVKCGACGTVIRTIAPEKPKSGKRKP